MYSGPATGLWTSPNPFSAVPAGSLKTADNVVFTAPSVIEPRRGFEHFAEFGTSESLANEMAFYGANLLVAYDFTKVAIKPPDGAFFEWAEAFVPNGSNRLRFEAAARSVFFNPASGIRVFDGAAGFSTGTSTAVGRALAYGGGSGDLGTATEVVGDNSGAAGTIALTTTAATGTIFFSVIASGPFDDSEPLTADSGWTGGAVGVDVPAIVVAGPADEFVVGCHVAGEASGATGVIVSRTVIGGDVVLGLSTVVGTFQVEVVAVGESTLAPLMAGCPQGLNILAINRSDDGWQLPDTAVAYRFTVCRKDAFGRIIEGPPSGRTTLRNILTVAPGYLIINSGQSIVNATAVNGAQTPHHLEIGDVITLTPGEADFLPAAYAVATVPTAYVFTYDGGSVKAGGAFNGTAQEFTITRSATLSLYLPDDVTVENFVRVYRSEMTLAAGDVPSDELFQCYESAYLSDAELAAGVLVFDDVTPESVLENPLYTNPNTGDGTLAANYRPPLAEDIVYWQNRMWFLNTTEKHSAQLALIGVGSPDGLQDGDSISFLPEGGEAPGDLITFTAVASGVGAGEFELFEDGDPGYNIQRTTQALCQAINDASDDGLPYAFYVSSETGTPGKMLLQARSFGDADGFDVYSSRGTAWTPQLPSATTPLWAPLESTDNAHAARLSYSKLGQPEAVPLLNFEPIDADNAPGLKLAALNYRLLIFKTDGLYFVPTGFPVALQKLSDHVLVAPDSVKRLGDAVFFLSDQGEMVVDDSGVRPVSVPIDDTLTALGAPASLPDLQTRTVAVAYRSARQYLLWVIEKDELGELSSDNEQAFVYSTLAAGFTRFTFGVRAAQVSPLDFVVNDGVNGGDRLFVAPTGSNAIWLERKSLTPADYFDDGDAAIPVEVVFNELTNEAPATMKMAQQCSFLFKQNSVPRIEALFASEIHPEFVPNIYLDTAGWGSFPWGQIPWGGFVRTVRRVEPLPVEVANCCQLFVGIRASIQGTKFQFLGIDVDTKKDTKANRG